MEYEDYPKWFFQYVFAATAATIVSGAIAERCQFAAYFLYSIIITGWVYPVVSHWAWSGDGWLSVLGCTAEELEMNSCNSGRGYYMDYAGSGVVHLLGAGCSLTGCYFMGPRRGRFNKRGEPLEMPGHSIPLAGLGGFILIFGFLAFNGGSQSTGAAFVYLCIHTLMIRAKLDDPLDAVAVHGGGGLWGLLCVPFFMSAGLKEDERGIIFDGHLAHPWTVLGVQMAAIAAILAWSIFWSSIIFGSMKLIKMLRVSTEVEFKGMDIVKHGESAYPAQMMKGLGGVPVQQGSQGGRERPHQPSHGWIRRDNGDHNDGRKHKEYRWRSFQQPFPVVSYQKWRWRRQQRDGNGEERRRKSLF